MCEILCKALRGWCGQSREDRGAVSRKLCAPELDRNKQVNDELSAVKADMRGILINYESAVRSIFEEQFRAAHPNDPPQHVPDPHGLFAGTYWNSMVGNIDGGSVYVYPKVRDAWRYFVKRHNVWSRWE